MLLGIVFGILVEFLGIEMIYKAKINENDSDEEKMVKSRTKGIGIAFFIIGSGLVLFCFLLALV